MSSRQFHLPALRRCWPTLAAAALLGAPFASVAVDLTITPGQRSTAQQVAQAGVPLSELSPNAPESHTVQRGDTLWDISKLFLTSPWRWPELWGMNMEQIRNPHLIYPGQVLVLVKMDGRAMLRVARPGQEGTAPTNTVKLSPRVRAELLDNGAIASIPLHLIGPFLNEAIVLDSDELASAPRIVATQEGRVLVSRGETAYVRGDLKGAREFRLFRESKPMIDPESGQVLGFEAGFVGTAEFTRAGDTRPTADGKNAVEVPASFRLTSVRQEAGIGDRLAPVPQRDFSAYAPHSPAGAIAGQIISIYGEALTAGQNQIVALNRGGRDGIERGHVLALWRNGAITVDKTDGKKTAIKLPDERIGMLFVFRVFDRVSYALIVSAIDPVSRGDRFTQP
ncbi:LysM peptidoglycan-binding domain-containing protein [Aquabacterium sp.]|uniref:LysM peptidoglycan-binding domain-containing protein n=1 Tax=Aquabacterium sp. TaxID=1872578 RepID=UPI002D0BF596|nr:LysM domain-containing protein [Aquabacterium sp.]